MDTKKGKKISKVNRNLQTEEKLGTVNNRGDEGKKQDRQSGILNMFALLNTGEKLYYNWGEGVSFSPY
jgi:hypothetical protein